MTKLVVFSGAGMSAESGISTFRDSNGLWENYDIQQVATPEAWERNPALVQVITENIDDLHERAGSLNVLHLHGNIRLAKSSGPDAQYTTQFYEVNGWKLDLEQDFCLNGYPLRPHVVWFGEAVPAYEEAIRLVQSADIFIVIGS
ncbi:SIR2 family NAD-dependent protein deacylase, partial [Klebsiella pneumoniae]|uniref:SIR2 family NAD-dependent protein deacylase n=1 Tax=Klebsiella pneumoniae TaxID=573 RepID=UPI00286A2362